MQVFTHNWDEFDVELSSDRTKKLEAALAVQYEGGTEVDRFLKFSGYAAVLTPGMCILPLFDSSLLYNWLHVFSSNTYLQFFGIWPYNLNL
jgi:hypothetical protein